MFDTFLLVIRIGLALALIILISVQGKGSGLSSGILGGSSQVYHSRKGFEKLLFRATITVAVLFLVSSLLGVL